MNFRERLQKPEPITIDGAMGTMIFQRLPDYKGSLELLNADRPDVIESIHADYFAAGSDIVETNTFGGSAVKLAEYGLESRCEELNELGARAAKKAAEKFNGFVAGSIGPTGILVQPMGDFSPEKIYESYAAQVRGLARGGADLIAIETMTDIQEARLALLAAKDNCGLPVLVSMTFEENSRTVTGTDIVTAFYTLAGMGADIIGANCSMGPDGLARVFSANIEPLRGAGVHMSVWSNAGLPEMVDGKLTYRLTPDLFAESSVRFAELGIKIIGGCCGTTPDHIRALRDKLSGVKIIENKEADKYPALTSRTSVFFPDRSKRPIVIGERLNPSARKAFAAELREGKNTFLRDDSRAQLKEGADILDINVGLPGIDESAAIASSVKILVSSVNIPLMIDSDNPEVVERALFSYPGIPVINSINGKKKSYETLIPLVKRFGAFAVALCLDETGVHRDSAGRISSGERLLEKISAGGIDLSKIFVDPLILTESAEPGAAVETLKVIKHFASRGIKTSIGLSNISYGLPERKFVNTAFLNMAIDAGLTAAIMNPSMKADTAGDEYRLAENFITGEDQGAAKYIAHFNSKKQTSAAAPVPAQDGNLLSKIKFCVIEGNGDDINEIITSSLNEGTDPNVIMNDALINGLEKVGELYSTGEYFLPQMIASAAAMKNGFAVLKPLLAAGSSSKNGRVVISTVKGDIHDIGKNIVAMMLENHGFEVFDLGKDVDSARIVEEAGNRDADIICLSSLLTTTMGEMKRVSEMVKSAGIRARLLVGGAVVTREYAESIGAAYSADAVEAAATAKILAAR